MIYIGIGIQGSGKTWHLKRFAQEENAVYICPDEHKLRLVNGDFSREANEVVWTCTFDQLKIAILSGKHVVLDATNLFLNQRKKLIEFCTALGQQSIVGIFFCAPYVLCWQRNCSRSRVVPRESFDRMVEWMDFPAIEEGFSQIWIVKNY